MDKRSQKTLEKIKKSFEKLLIENKDGNITVKEITALSNINRKTFYIYFDCIEDLYQDFEDQIEKTFIDILDKKSFFDKNFSLKQFLNSFLELINTNPKLYEKLLVDDRYKFVFRRIKDRTKERIVKNFLPNNDPIIIDIQLDFLFAGLIKVFRVWQNKKDQVTLEQLYSATYSIIRHGISNIEIEQ